LRLCAAATLLALSSCGPAPFNVNVTVFFPESYLSGSMPLPGGAQEIPPETIDLGAMTWNLPLHDLRVALDLSSRLPQGPISEATMTIICGTGRDPANADGSVDADAAGAIYVAPESAGELWQEEWRSSAGELKLVSGEPVILAAPLTPAQVEALSAERIRIGLEVTAPAVQVTGTTSELSLLDGFVYSIEEIRVVGTAEVYLFEPSPDA
jgi:hypothetical protein